MMDPLLACAGCQPCTGCGQHVPKTRQRALCERCAAQTADVTREPTGGQGLRELVARCDNHVEPSGTPCPGLLRYRWGQIEAACNTCGGRCGIAVASWLTVTALDGEPQP